MPGTVAQLIAWAEGQLACARVVYGHGSGSGRDEAAAIIYKVLGLDHADPAAYQRPVGRSERGRIADLVRQRIDRRIPAPYLLREAWFAGQPYYVDDRVLIPRSPFAELIKGRFGPWWPECPAPRILEIGTGSGCIAVACALEFSDSQVLATDLCWPALQVARLNVGRHGVAGRVHLLQADLLRGVRGRFDLILSNPPYVPDAEMASLPPEYACEPRVALAGGADGLELVRGILQDAAQRLQPHGWLAVEVGAGAAALERSFPGVPFFWPDLRRGGDGIALVSAADLAAAGCDSSLSK